MKYKKGSFIGLISSVSPEGKYFIRDLTKEKITTYLTFYTGKIVDKEVVYTISSIGKTNAAHAATLLIQNYSPRLVINFGIGGAYPSSGLKVGDIAVATKEIYADEGVWLKDGFHTAEVIGIPFLVKGRRKYFNEFPLDKRLIKKAVKASNPVTCLRLRRMSLDTKIKLGSFVTVSTCTGTLKQARELEKRFNAICENMEGAAIAHICAIYRTPMVEIRGISNIIEDRDTGKWDLKLAAENCQKVVMELLKTI